MSKVFVHMGISLDGYVAGTNRGPKNPMGGVSPKLHAWMFEQQAFRRELGIPGEGKTGPDNDLVKRTFDRIGANIMGKRMFDEGEAAWPENAPFHNSVFVLTHEKRDPWVRPGGTTFYFTNDSLERVLANAREAAGAKDVRISGGRDVVIQYLEAGLVDELLLDITPVLLTEGLRLFENIDRNKVKLEIADVIHSPAVTHARYRISKSG
jgi:dihydrofolate reductase